MPGRDQTTFDALILELLAGAKPYLVVERDLVEQIEAEHDHKPNTTRKALRQLDRRGLITKWQDSPYGYAVMLSCLAAEHRAIEIHQSPYELRDTEKTAAIAIKAHFREGRWGPRMPLKEPPPDAYAKVDGPGSAIAEAFREADAVRTNPYYGDDARGEPREINPDHEIRKRDCRTSDDERDEQGLYEVAEHRRPSGLVPVGINTHPGWCPALEFAGRPEDCPVCAGCRPERGRWVCLGCTRSSRNIGETSEARPSTGRHEIDPGIRAVLDRLAAVKIEIDRIPVHFRKSDAYLELAGEKHRLLAEVGPLSRPRRSARQHQQLAPVGGRDAR